MLIRARRLKRFGSTTSAVPSQLLPTISTGRVAGRLAAAVATGPAASSAATATHAERSRIARNSTETGVCEAPVPTRRARAAAGRSRPPRRAAPRRGRRGGRCGPRRACGPPRAAPGRRPARQGAQLGVDVHRRLAAGGAAGVAGLEHLPDLGLAHGRVHRRRGARAGRSSPIDIPPRPICSYEPPLVASAHTATTMATPTTTNSTIANASSIRLIVTWRTRFVLVQSDRGMYPLRSC